MTPAARQKSAISAWSFVPRTRSTPLETSTPHGRTDSIALATFAGVNPPASSTRARSDGIIAADDATKAILLEEWLRGDAEAAGRCRTWPLTADVGSDVVAACRQAAARRRA